MPKLPFPPSVDDLRSIGAEEIVLPAGAHLARIYSSGGKHPTQWNQFRYWGPTESRFDHHLVNSDGKAHLQDGKKNVALYTSPAMTNLVRLPLV